MLKEEIIEKIINSDNKIGLLMDEDFLEKLKEAREKKVGDIVFYDSDLITYTFIEKYFSEDEKVRVIDDENFLNRHFLKKAEIIKLLSDKNKMDIILEDESIQKWEIKDIIKTLSDDNKLLILKEVKGFKNFEYAEILCLLDDEHKMDFLSDVENCAEYSLSQDNVVNIIASFSDEMKVKVLNDKDFVEKYALNKEDRMAKIISKMDKDFLVQFIKDNKDFLKDSNIEIYKIVNNLNTSLQLDFLSNLEEMNLSERRKKENIRYIKERNKRRIN